MAEELSDEEAALYDELAEEAGVVATRLLAERGLIYLEDLAPEEAREVLRTAWLEATEARFAGQDLEELRGEIHAMIDSLVIDLSRPPGVAVH